MDEKEKEFIVVDVIGMTPQQIEDRMNELHESKYDFKFESNIQFYQGVGESGMLTFQKRPLTSAEIWDSLKDKTDD